ncbi:MAG: hypothetical protein ACP5FZ_04365 [Fidelibacterota bacterium]
MKHTVWIFLLLFLGACSQKTVEEKPGRINFRIIEFDEARIEARDSGRRLLAYFYTDW